MQRQLRVIPVLDLRHGVVVQAIRGDRERYQPLRSCLTPSTDPLVVAAAFRDCLNLHDLYVADLDGLIEGRVDWPWLAKLASCGMRLFVDPGVRVLGDAQRLADLGIDRVVVALESLTDWELLEEVLTALGPVRVCFSLDLQAGATLGDGCFGANALEVMEGAWQRGVRSAIVLDLAGVGGQAGCPTLELCRDLRTRYPSLELVTGGGTRHEQDLRAATEVGVDGVLVATALHNGPLNRETLAQLRHS